MGSENRRHPRASVALVARVKLDSMDQFVERSASSLSLGGMQLCMKEPVETGSRLKLDFRLADGQPLIQASAVVRWCRQQGERYSAGVQFVDMDAASRRLIEEVVSRTQERRTHGRVPLVLRLRVTASGQKTLAECCTADISIGGVRLSSDVPIPIGNRLHIAFLVGGKPLFESEAEVRWCQPNGDKFSIGAEFLSLDERGRKAVETLMRNRPRDETDIESLFALEGSPDAEVREERAVVASKEKGKQNLRGAAALLAAVLLVAGAVAMAGILVEPGETSRSESSSPTPVAVEDTPVPQPLPAVKPEQASAPAPAPEPIVTPPSASSSAPPAASVAVTSPETVTRPVPLRDPPRSVISTSGKSRDVLPAISLKRILRPRPGNLEIVCDGGIESRLRQMEIEHPKRLILDLEGVDFFEPIPYPRNPGPPFRHVRLGHHPTLTRVVIEIQDETRLDVTVQGERILIHARE